MTPHPASGGPAADTDDTVVGGGSPDATPLVRLKRRITYGKRLSPKYGELADYILRHPRDVAFSTAAELAEAAKVSEATVIRFGNAMGYESYADFRRDFQKWINDELTTIHRMRDSLDRKAGENTLADVVREEIANLEQTLTGVSVEEVRLVANLMLNAERVYVVGLRASSGLARYLAYEASAVVPGVSAITTGGSDVLTEISSCERGLVVVFGFPRYPQETVEIIDAARRAKLATVAITDSVSSPLVERSDVVLYAHHRSMGPVDLFAGPFAVASAVVLEAARGDQDRSLQNLARFERAADAVGLYWSPQSPSTTSR